MIFVSSQNLAHSECVVSKYFLNEVLGTVVLEKQKSRYLGLETGRHYITPVLLKM